MNKKAVSCPVETTLAVIHGRWKVLVIHHLLDGVKRFGELHRAMACRRVYLHPVRWTSLGLSLIEAMHLGMPVVALATTEATRAVPPEAGVVSTRLEEIEEALVELAADHAAARRMGRAARDAALAHYALPRFLADWDRLLDEVTR